MAIANGTRIGPYEIVGWLGAGGMGDVYRAHDVRLARDVAIKLIADAFAIDPVRRQRFEQEARAAGQLNHPNILVVFDVGTHDLSTYIVSELLEGETLRSRLRKGAIPAHRAIDYARQIADGLAAAHDRHIVHRHIKPDNLFITNDGRVKILDFGIAKLARPSDDGATPTALVVDTEIGTIIGTTAYMSPEQVRGESVDSRSDIFSFGMTLYEMLSGRSPFARDTAPETMTAILKDEPPSLTTESSPQLARIALRCLEKTREARFQSARDLAFALASLSEITSPTGPSHATDPRRFGRVAAWTMAAAAVIGVAVAAAWTLRPSDPTAPLVSRFQIPLPADQIFDGSGGAHVVAMSPDGSRIAYVATPSRLYLRTLSEFDAKVIPGMQGLEGVRDPVFSPDGRAIVFFAFTDQTLKRVAVSGGAIQTICAAENPTGITWASNSIIYGQPRGIMRVSAEGGTPELLVPVAEGQHAYGPRMLPDGDHLLFTRATGTVSGRWDKAEIVVHSLTSGKSKTLFTGGSDARYVPTGHIVYALSGTVYAIAFDKERLEVTGNAVALIDGVSRAAGMTSEFAVSGGGNFSFSNSGSLAYVPGPISLSAVGRDIALQDQHGVAHPLKLPPGPYAVPRVSPDGTRIAFGNDDNSEGTIWTYDLRGGSNMARLTFGGNNRFPVWTSDGTRVTFQSDREGDRGLFWQRVDGGVAERLTTAAPGTSHVAESWSPDGKTLLYRISERDDVALWMLSRDGARSMPFGKVHSSTPTGAVFSPNGRWVAYSVSARGRTTIYVEPFPPTGQTYQLLARGADGPHHPRWSADGTQLFYNPRPGGLDAVRIVTEPTFSFGNPVKLPKVFQGGAPNTATSYDVMPDGKFLGLVGAGQAEHVLGSANQIHVVLNWFEDLKARVPK